MAVSIQPEPTLDIYTIGYQHYFKERVPGRLKCPICTFVLHYPRQSIECGHRFCYGCIEKFLRENDPAICPVPDCGEQLNRDRIFRDNATRREVDQLIVYCDFREAGCTVEIQLRDLEKHKNELCEFAIIDCLFQALGCQTRTQRGKLAEHLENECLYRQVQCDYCTQEFPFSELKGHYNICLKFPIICPNKCSKKKIPRELINQHLKSCPKQENGCSYSNWGCTFSGFGPDVIEHEKSQKAMIDHLNFVKNALANTELSFTEAKREITELQNQKTITETKLKDQISATVKLQQENANMDEKLKVIHKTVASVNDKYLKLDKKVEGSADKEDVKDIKKLVESFQDIHKTLESRIAKEERRRIGGGGSGGDRGGGGGFADIIDPIEIEQLKAQAQQHDRQLGMHDIRLAEQDLRFQILETASYDGVLIWKIKDYTRRKQEAVSGRTLSLYSQPFYTSRYGYKMCARVYLNGDGMGKGSHMSLFFVIMRGDYDALLPWPFKQKVTLMLLDQETGRRHMSDTFRPDPTSSSFRRPTSDMNIASGCPLFVSHSVLESPTYIKSDTLFIKVIVDTSDLYGP